MPGGDIGTSKLNPDDRDRFDAYGYPEHNEIYFDKVARLPVTWSFEAVTGFFQQSDDSTNDMQFNYTFENFGIVDEDWLTTMQRFKQLQQADGRNKYKMMILARHGEGYHNVANARHRQDWASKWRFLGTDGDITWGPDADLTDLGIAQAQENQAFLSHQVSQGMPIPTKFYVSPLQRSIKTCLIEWDHIEHPIPIVNEKVRETIGINLCHKRSTKTNMQKFPIDFPPGFPEQDDIFNSFTTREEYYQQFLRIHDFLQDVFNHDHDDIISVTCHAGSIRAFLTVIKHRGFTIPTGGMIPIIIKATNKV